MPNNNNVLHRVIAQLQHITTKVPKQLSFWKAYYTCKANMVLLNILETKSSIFLSRTNAILAYCVA